MSTNNVVEALLNRRSIRKFTDEPIDDETINILETAAQRAPSSQFLNDWSAIRVTDPALKAQLAQFGHQPYIATAPLLYVFILDEHRNIAIAQAKGVDPDHITLKNSYRFAQAQNDAVLALHAMETAANALGLGCVILGSILNDIPGLIEQLNLPQYTYPVLGLAIGKPAQEPRSNRVCHAVCSSSTTRTRLTMRPRWSHCLNLMRKCTSITICAILTARLMRSAIRSPT